MPVIIGTTSMRLFSGDFLADGHFLDPFDGDHRSPSAELYGTTRGVFQIYSRMEGTIQDRFGELLKLKDDIAGIVSSLGSGDIPGYITGLAGTYHHADNFIRGLGEKLAVDAQHVEIVYPNTAFNFIEVAFDAFSQEDEIRDFFTSPSAPVKHMHAPEEFGISMSTPREDNHDVPVEGDTWDNHSKVVYRINLQRLLEEKGDGAYGYLPLTFGFGMTSLINGDMSILHFLNLKITRPPAPIITSVSNTFVSVGESIEISGQNFLGAHVKIGGTNAEIRPGSLNAFGVAVTVPLEVSHESDLPLIVTTPGGMSTYMIQIHRPLANVHCIQNSFKVGDIIDILGVGLEHTATVTFLRQTHFGPFDHVGLPTEYPATWLFVPERASEIADIDLRRLRVSIPAGMSDQVSIRITQQLSGQSVVIGPFAYNPGAPRIESANFVRDPRSLRFNITGKITISGTNLLYSPTIFWGGEEVTEIVSNAPDSLSFVPSDSLRKGRVELRTRFGIALSETITLPTQRPIE